MFKQVIHSWMYGSRTLKEVLESVRSIGADGIDLTMGVGPTPDQYLKMNVRSLIDDYGLVLPSMTIGYVAQQYDLSHSEKSVREGAIEYSKKCIDVAANVGCDRVLVVPSWVSERHVIYKSFEEDWNHAVESLQIVAEHAQKSNISIMIEPVNRYRVSLVRTVDEALKMIADIGFSNVHIVADTFHMNIEEPFSISRSILKAGSHLKCLHIGDNNRRSPGNGTLDWREIIGALIDIGFDGPLSYEPVYNAYQGNKVSSDDSALKAFESELKSGIDFLRGVMQRMN